MRYILTIFLFLLLISCNNTKGILKDKPNNKKEDVLVLDLSNKNLEALPFEIAAYTNLEKLKLNNNNFSIFPIEVLDLKKLKVLDLSSNNLSAIPNEIDKLVNLKTIDLSDNSIKVLPNTLENLLKLRMIVLIENPISVEMYDSIKCMVNDSCKILIAHEFFEEPPYECNDKLK